MPVSLYLAVAAGGALGSVARFALSGAIAGALGPAFPWGTLLVNVSGSFAIGFFGALSRADGGLLVSGTARAFVLAGVCGGYTTFSAFSLETLKLATEGAWFAAGSNVLASVALCLIFVWLGAVAAGALNPLQGG